MWGIRVLRPTLCPPRSVDRGRCSVLSPLRRAVVVAWTHSHPSSTCAKLSECALLFLFFPAFLLLLLRTGFDRKKKLRVCSPPDTTSPVILFIFHTCTTRAFTNTNGLGETAPNYTVRFPDNHRGTKRAISGFFFSTHFSDNLANFWSKTGYPGFFSKGMRALRTTLVTSLANRINHVGDFPFLCPPLNIPLGMFLRHHHRRRRRRRHLFSSRNANASSTVCVSMREQRHLVLRSMSSTSWNIPSGLRSFPRFIIRRMQSTT